MENSKKYFIHKLAPCRESNYKEAWMCRTGNITTVSTKSITKCIELHLKKINKIESVKVK